MSRDELYQKVRIISEEIRLNRARFGGQVTMMVMDRMTRSVQETKARTRRKT